MRTSSLLQRASAAVSVFARGVAASARFATTAYQGASHKEGALKFWRPSLLSADREFLPEQRTLKARTRELARNNPVVASAARRRMSSSVGVGWHLAAQVDGEALNFTPEETESVNTQIERAWRGYAYGHAFEMDAQRQLTFGGLLRTVARSWFIDGEAFAHVAWSPGEMCSNWATRLDVIDTDRVCNPNNAGDTDLIRGGVELDPLTRAPIAYWVRQGHPADVAAPSGAASWRRIERWTPWGRPNFLHIYDRERAGQTRGVSQLVAVLGTLKSLEKFGQATLENAILNALMLGAIKSTAGPSTIGEEFNNEDLKKFHETRDEYYGGPTVNLAGGVQFPVLAPEDEMQIFTQAREVASFEGFERFMIRGVAAAVGTTYEETWMDYSTTNYSSARAAMIPAYMETQTLQTLIRDQGVQPFYVGWLEEAIETGWVALPLGAPDYWLNLDLYTQARWIAPGRGYIDATKEIQADAMAVENMFITRTDVAASQGRVFRDDLKQLKRELLAMAAEGLAPVAGGVTLAAAAAPQIVAPDAPPIAPPAAA